MKRNINLMQSNLDLQSLNESEFDKLLKEYVLQALANLGQRIGIKGDGLSYQSFSFLDLLNNENISYNGDKHIGWLQYRQNDSNELIATFGITNFNNGEETLLTNINTKNINDILYTNNEFQFTIPVNNIEKYSKNSIICNDNDELTIITVGKLLGYDDEDENNAVLLYYKFDINTNKPIYVAKLGFVDSTNSSSYYYALELNKLENNNEYELKIKIFDSNLLDNYTNTFNELFIYSNHNNGEDLGFAFLRKDFIDLNNFKAYNSNTNMNYDSNSPLSVIMNNVSNNNYYTSNTLKIYLDTEANEFLYSDEESFRDIISLYKNEYNFVDIEEELYNINNDITDLYRNILLYYNEKFFNESRSQLIKRILCTLYENIVKESKSDYNKMYVPLNYEFNYVCNSNDTLNIYWSNDIYVLYSNLSKQLVKSDILSSSNYVIFDYGEIEKVYSYRFEIEYNKKYENIINDINVKKIYSMPYVDANENWNINGNSTSIRAIGKNAGNPNIIIVYSKNKNETLNQKSYEIINTIANLDFSNEDFVREKFLIDNSLFANITSNDIYCYGWVPVITEANKELFENSIILNICKLDCLENSLLKDYYLGSNILTLWYYSCDDNEYKFKLVKKDDKYAMPFGVTENLESIINGSTLLNINEQELLILKAKIESLGQESLNENNERWAIIRNKNAEEYNNDDYKNNLNAIIEYTDYLKYNIENEKTIVKYNQLNKFINSFESLGRNDITNALYPKNEAVTEIHDIATEEDVEELIRYLDSVEETAIEFSNGKFVVTNKIYDVIKQSIERKKANGISQISTKVIKNENNDYWYEYLFNDNIPSIDFKEIFLRNINTLNRYNILSLTEEGNIYYGYLGSSYEEKDKSTLHLGTLNKNINIGTDTLINEVDNDLFKKYDKLSIDFNRIFLNSPKALMTSSYPYTIKEINGYSFILGKYWILDSLVNTNINIDNTDILYSFTDDIKNISEYFDSTHIFYDYDNQQYNVRLYDDPIVKIESSEKSYYLISINSVLNKLLEIDLLDFIKGKITINSGSNKIIIVRNTGLERTVPIFLLLINDTVVNEVAPNIIWSTDTLDLLCNINKENNEISIITKFDKYNYKGVDRYIVWDYDGIEQITIYPDQNKSLVDIEIISYSVTSPKQSMTDIIGETIIPITITYTYRGIYDDGTYTNIGEGSITINRTHTIIPNSSSSTINDSVTIGNVNITELGQTKEQSIPNLPITVNYLPYDFDHNILAGQTISEQYCTNKTIRIDGNEKINDAVYDIEPDNNDHIVQIQKTYEVPIVYKNGYSENKSISGSWTYTVNANNDSTENIKTISIGNENKTISLLNIGIPVHIDAETIKINKKEDTSRNGYYFYIGDTIPNVANTNFKTVQLANDQNDWNGWRYLINDLNNTDNYAQHILYEQDEADRVRFVNRIYDMNGETPYISSGIIYIVLPEGTICKDAAEVTINNWESAGSVTNNTAGRSVVYNIYRYTDNINYNFPYDIYLSTDTNYAYPSTITDYECTNISLGVENIIGNGVTQDKTVYLTYMIEAIYSNNKTYNIEKEIELTYQITQTNNTGDIITYTIPSNVQTITFGSNTYNFNVPAINIEILPNS